MEIREILNIESVISGIKATGKKQILKVLSNKLSKLAEIEASLILSTLLEREKLGTTGIGQGVAIPHGKISSLQRSYGFFARLEEPVDSEAVDDEPVDLIFLLLAPENNNADHLKMLAKISRLLRNQNLCKKLRGSDGEDALYSVLTESAYANSN